MNSVKKEGYKKIECLSVLFFRKRRRLESEIEGSFNGGEKRNHFGHWNWTPTRQRIERQSSWRWMKVSIRTSTRVRTEADTTSITWIPKIHGFEGNQFKLNPKKPLKNSYSFYKPFFSSPSFSLTTFIQIRVHKDREKEWKFVEIIYQKNPFSLQDFSLD